FDDHTALFGLLSYSTKLPSFWITSRASPLPAVPVAHIALPFDAYKTACASACNVSQSSLSAAVVQMSRFATWSRTTSTPFDARTYTTYRLFGDVSDAPPRYSARPAVSRSVVVVTCAGGVFWRV